MIEAEYISESEPTKYIPYLALTGELWDVFYEDLGENWPRYNGTKLYVVPSVQLYQYHISKQWKMSRILEKYKWNN